MLNDGTVIVEISNSYECGRQSGGRLGVPSPSAGGLDEWWERVVLPETGDGHSCGSREHALYEAVIVAAPDAVGLVGRSRTWVG